MIPQTGACVLARALTSGGARAAARHVCLALSLSRRWCVVLQQVQCVRPARYEATEYDPAKGGEAAGGTHVYRLLRHVDTGVFARVFVCVVCLCVLLSCLFWLGPNPCLHPHGKAHTNNTPPARRHAHQLQPLNEHHPTERPLKLRIHSSSVLARVRPPLVVFARCAQSDEGWYEMQGVCAVEQGWLLEAAPHVFQQRR